MYVMGLFEFKEYLQSSHYLSVAVEEYERFTFRGYADIHPTRIKIDYDQGKMYKEGMNVENYVIWLVESKDILIKDQQFWQRRLNALNRALQILTPLERDIYNLFSIGKTQSRLQTEPVLLKIRDQLELLIDSSPVLKERSLDDEDADFDEDSEEMEAELI
ncbi:hypothetical protein A1A1_16740 [Planococcus antarcticus DSM 14505]|uniref:Uncharacterized protein n=1 Tax=Planococcus antarcticus DSM 14505 TaxID=1185653 RepID=A0AA87IHV4_9BACL|nr:hypothetical protein [Planococcus antarcticus]EIM05330.1 hypothetical protein A1A1_16740 [Planococcus antarcticus DSM 14505]